MAAVITVDSSTVVFQRIIWKNLSKFKMCLPLTLQTHHLYQFISIAHFSTEIFIFYSLIYVTILFIPDIFDLLCFTFLFMPNACLSNFIYVLKKSF